MKIDKWSCEIVTNVEIRGTVKRFSCWDLSQHLPTISLFSEHNFLAITDELMHPTFSIWMVRLTAHCNFQANSFKFLALRPHALRLSNEGKRISPSWHLNKAAMSIVFRTGPYFTMHTPFVNNSDNKGWPLGASCLFFWKYMFFLRIHKNVDFALKIRSLFFRCVWVTSMFLSH